MQGWSGFFPTAFSAAFTSCNVVRSVCGIDIGDHGEGPMSLILSTASPSSPSESLGDIAEKMPPVTCLVVLEPLSVSPCNAQQRTLAYHVHLGPLESRLVHCAVRSWSQKTWPIPRSCGFRTPLRVVRELTRKSTNTYGRHRLDQPSKQET